VSCRQHPQWIWGQACPYCASARGEHEHAWFLQARVERAEIDEADPVAHTSFMLLECACGAVTAFPLENYALTTARYKARLRGELAAQGRFFDPVAR